MNPALEVLKTGGFTFGVERDDLAVEHQRLGARPRPVRECRRDLRKLVGLFVAEPRPESYIAFRQDLGDRADAVVLRFVNQLRVVVRRVDERREHRVEDVVHCWGLGARGWD
jgi:hypothetical protein